MFGSINSKIKVIEKSLDASWLRNEVISQNISNIDTPGYRRKSVSFEKQLKDALEISRKSSQSSPDMKNAVTRKNLDKVEAKVIQDNTNLDYRLDGNNVDIDVEMAAMAKNTIKYNVLTQSLNSSFRRIKSVINEGRKW